MTFLLCEFIEFDGTNYWLEVLENIVLFVRGRIPKRCYLDASWQAGRWRFAKSFDVLMNCMRGLALPYVATGSLLLAVRTIEFVCDSMSKFN